MASTKHHPPRPRWNDRKVKEAAVDTVFDAVQKWTASSGVFGPDADVDLKQLRAIVALSLSESADAYGAGRYLETFADLPTDGELIRILDRAFAQMPRIAESATMDWVMQNNVRFTAAKGDVITFAVGDATMTGTVVGVVGRMATGYVEVARSKGRVMPVPGEDVIKNLGPAKKKKAPPPKSTA